MTARDSDPGIRRLFEEERLADEAVAPGLDALLSRDARRHSAPHTLRRVALAVSVIAAAVVTAAVFRAAAFRREASDASTLPPAVLELARWKAPSDTLLETPGSDLWTSVPDLAPPAPVTATGIPVAPTKGVPR